MISPDDLRLYHRQATLYVLQSGERMTAAEIHEALTGMALSSGHPKECATITPAGVAGILRALQGEGLTAMNGERRNTRHGRAEPTWVRATMAKSVDAPRAPAARQTTRPSLDATDPMAGLSREQLLAMTRRKVKAEPWVDEGRDPLELIARLLVGGSYRVPVEGRSTIAPLSSADIAGAVGYMPDSLEKHAALTVATRGEGVAIAHLVMLAHGRVAGIVGAARPRPLDLSLPADRWRLRLVTFDAAHELVWPERRQSWGVLAKAAKMRRSTYCEVHRAATAVLQAALNDGRREFHGRLFSPGRHGDPSS